MYLPEDSYTALQMKPIKRHRLVMPTPLAVVIHQLLVAFGYGEAWYIAEACGIAHAKRYGISRHFVPFGGLQQYGRMRYTRELCARTRVCEDSELTYDVGYEVVLLPAASGWAWHVGIGLVWVGGECYCPPLPMVERACKEYGSHVGVGPPGLCAGEDSLFGFALLQRTVGYALARALCSTSVGARIWGGGVVYVCPPALLANDCKVGG